MVGLYIFDSLKKVQQIVTELLWSCSNERCNMGNGGMTSTRDRKWSRKFYDQAPGKTGRITAGQTDETVC